jgi:hypothetical protein
MKRKLILGVCSLAVLAAPAFALFGLGDIVFDPSNLEENIQQLVQLEQQYAQMVETYEVTLNQYLHMVQMARMVPVNMIARYKAPATPWHNSFATNTYGTTGGWVTGINSGVGVASGYANAIQSLMNYGAAFGNLPADQLERVKTGYATVELADGANQLGIETIGRLRANAPQVATAIDGLEADSLSSDPNMNTEIAVLNKINAANMISVRGTQDTNQILVTLAEQQIIDSKRSRDAEAQAINDHVQFVGQGQAYLNAQSANASGAMLAWRMP